MTTIDQQRAAHALARVQAVPDRQRTSYRAYVERLGPAIVMNGLGQALATELAAAGSGDDTDDQGAHRTLYENLAGWLCRPGDGIYPDADLLPALVAGDQPHYLRAQAEALAWLTWHKKFCQAELPRRAPGGGPEV